jgi:hypothetical protein
MRSTSPAELDDVAIEALLHGDPPAAARHIAPFVAGVRAAADGPPPRPTLELARLIAQAPETVTGESAAAVPITAARQRRHRRALAGRAARVAIAVKVGLGAVAAAAGVGGAASLHVLPGAPGDAVRDVISAVTPFEFDREPPATPGGPARPGGPPSSDGVPSDNAPDGTGGDHGDAVSSDATGADDGTPGVDGQSVADSAPGDELRPADGDPSAASENPAAGPPSDEGGTSSTTVPPEDDATGPPPQVTPPSTTGNGQGNGRSADAPGVTARP